MALQYLNVGVTLLNKQEKGDGIVKCMGFELEDEYAPRSVILRFWKT